MPRGRGRCRGEHSNVFGERFQNSRRSGQRLGGLFRTSGAREKLPNLNHRYSRIESNGYERISRCLDTFCLGLAKEVPDRIFDIVRIDRLVELKLLDAFFVFLGVIVGDAPLPVMRLLIRIELNNSIEIGNRLLELAKFKIRHAARLVGAR